MVAFGFGATLSGEHLLGRGGTLWQKGARKRLAAPYHRRQLRRVATFQRSTDGHGAEQGSAASAGGHGPAVGHQSSLAAAVDFAATGRADAADELRSRFHIARSTYLEDPLQAGSARSDFGDSGRELVLAVELDAVFALIGGSAIVLIWRLRSDSGATQCGTTSESQCTTWNGRSGDLATQLFCWGGMCHS